MSEQGLFNKKSRCERYVVRSDVVRVLRFELKGTRRKRLGSQGRDLARALRGKRP